MQLVSYDINMIKETSMFLYTIACITILASGTNGVGYYSNAQENEFVQESKQNEATLKVRTSAEKLIKELAPMRIERWKTGAHLGDPVAQFFYGFCLEMGYSVDINKTQSIKWFEKSAEGGFPLAMFLIGNRYLEGENVKKDEKKAISFRFGINSIRLCVRKRIGRSTRS
jgi:TPR repeat protein